MGKKSKKNKKKAGRYFDLDYRYGSGNGSKKKGKKGKKDAKNQVIRAKAPKLRDVHGTLDKSEIKECRETVLSPVKVPKAFKQSRIKCNHGGSVISVAEFKRMTPSYAAYTPMLDFLVNKYGEDSTSVCKSCYDVLVSPSKVTVSDVEDAIGTLYAAVNVAVSTYRMKKKEVKEMNSLKDSLQNFNSVRDVLIKIDESLNAPPTGNASGTSAANLNQVGNARFTV